MEARKRRTSRPAPAGARLGRRRAAAPQLLVARSDAQRGAWRHVRDERLEGIRVAAFGLLPFAAAATPAVPVRPQPVQRRTGEHAALGADALSGETGGHTTHHRTP